MAKAHTETDFQQPQDVVVAVDPQASGPPLYGNENYVSDHRDPKAPRPGTQHTQAEWLAEATEMKTVLERGDRVSYLTLEMLFLDAYDVIAGYTPPAARDAKKKADDDDEKRREK